MVDKVYVILHSKLSCTQRSATRYACIIYLTNQHINCNAELYHCIEGGLDPNLEEVLRPYQEDSTEPSLSQNQPSPSQNQSPPVQNQYTDNIMVNQKRKRRESLDKQWPTRGVDWMDYFPIEDNPQQLMLGFIPEDNADMFTPQLHLQ